MAETRIKSLDMRPVDMMIILAEGNPGAVSAMMACAAAATTIDPDSALGPLAPICHG